MIWDDKTQSYIHNPSIIGGVDQAGLEALRLNNAKLFKWGYSNQHALEEINKVTEDVEVEKKENK